MKSVAECTLNVCMLRFKISHVLLLRRESVWANCTHGMDNKLMTLLKGSTTTCYYVMWLDFTYNLYSLVDLVNVDDVV